MQEHKHEQEQEQKRSLRGEGEGADEGKTSAVSAINKGEDEGEKKVLCR